MASNQSTKGNPSSLTARNKKKREKKEKEIISSITGFFNPSPKVKPERKSNEFMLGKKNKGTERKMSMKSQSGNPATQTTKKKLDPVVETAAKPLTGVREGSSSVRPPVVKSAPWRVPPPKSTSKDTPFRRTPMKYKKVAAKPLANVTSGSSSVRPPVAKAQKKAPVAKAQKKAPVAKAQKKAVAAKPLANVTSGSSSVRPPVVKSAPWRVPPVKNNKSNKGPSVLDTITGGLLKAANFLATGSTEPPKKKGASTPKRKSNIPPNINAPISKTMQPVKSVSEMKIASGGDPKRGDPKKRKEDKDKPKHKLTKTEKSPLVDTGDFAQPKPEDYDFNQPTGNGLIPKGIKEAPKSKLRKISETQTTRTKRPTYGDQDPNAMPDIYHTEMPEVRQGPISKFIMGMVGSDSKKNKRNGNNGFRNK